MPVRVITLDQRALWNDTLERLPAERRDVYFTPEYYEIYQRNGEGEATCFIFEKDGDVALYPFLKNSLDPLDFIDLPGRYFDIQGAYGYNGVVSTRQDPPFRAAFFKAFREWCRDSGIIAEFLRFHPLMDTHRFSEGFLEIIRNRTTVAVPLVDEQGGRRFQWIWDEQYKYRTRRHIRKARKNDLVCKITREATESYLRFHRMYIQTMKNVSADAYYFFPESYILDFRNLLGDRQFLVEVFHGDTVIHAVLIMFEGRYAHYHLGARNPEFGRLGGGYFAMSHAIQAAQESNCDLFHLGGGNSDSPEDPLFQFKSGFSKERFHFFIGKTVHNPDIYERVVNAWRKAYPEKESVFGKLILKYRF